jgi:hypothetical protein
MVTGRGRNPCLHQWAGTFTLLIILGSHGIKGGGVISMEITEVKNPSKNRRYVVPSQAGGLCHVMGVRGELGDEAIVGPGWGGGYFEGVVGGGGRNGKIGWFVLGGRLMISVLLRLKNSRRLMCPV